LKFACKFILWYLH